VADALIIAVSTPLDPAPAVVRSFEPSFQPSFKTKGGMQ
jgi:hypothetical protein